MLIVSDATGRTNVKDTLRTDRRQTDEIAIANTKTSRSHVRVKIRALCGIFSAISALLTTKNPDGLEILVPDGSRSLKVTLVNSSCVICYLSLIVPEAISCTV